MYKIGIIGLGVVGKGIYRVFEENVSSIYDPFYEIDGKKVFSTKESKMGFSDVDLTVIAVPTNEKKDWSADTSLVWESLEWVREINKEGVILIKSTVPPLELEEMQKAYGHIVFSPEYMGESKYFTPEWKYPHPQRMESHTWQTFGGNLEDTTVCIDIFKRKMGVDCQYWQTDLKTASMAKYIENSFFAMKVTFVNEWFDMANKVGVDWNELRELWLLDPRINRNHTLVFPKDRGYGGKCFPKDTRAIIKHMDEIGYSPKLMLAMDLLNWGFRNNNEQTNRVQ